ncbi:MAG: hypothetical protein ACPG6R_10970 [Aequoribacter sp.]|uniref:hypothetical protein n=1 Tax=Aequoribacter sp. TaxID=2847771 RepID=UPI003C4F9F75
MRKNSNIALALALAAAVGFIVGGGKYPPSALAASGPGYVDSFSVSCGTSATKIQSSFGQVSYVCEVDEVATAAVFVGDAFVTTSTGMEYEAAEDFGGNVYKEYCIVATGTQTVNCRAQVGTEPTE